LTFTQSLSVMDGTYILIETLLVCDLVLPVRVEQLKVQNGRIHETETRHDACTQNFTICMRRLGTRPRATLQAGTLAVVHLTRGLI
jgi:hypothetical protein